MAFDDWCTPPEALDVLADLTGWRTYDLDPASNRHSRVPCRLALIKPVRGVGASRGVAVRDARVAKFPAEPPRPGGSVRMVADGCFTWPAERRVFLNPPYSSIRPWVPCILAHAAAGGEGAAVLPLLLDSTWAHALLEARVDLQRALRTIGLPARPVVRASVHLYAWRGRLSFLDPRRDGAPGTNGRSGTLLVVWGATPRAGALAGRSLTCL